jgi:hypothetical protein
MMTVMVLGHLAPAKAQDTTVPLVSNGTASPSSIPEAGGPITLQVTATDNGPQDTGLAQVYVERQIDNGTFAFLVTLTDPDQNGTYTGSFNPGRNTSANPRTFSFRFHARDKAGNNAQPLMAAQTVTQDGGDAAPPQLSGAQVSPSFIPAAGGPITLQVTATDNAPQDTGINLVSAERQIDNGTFAFTVNLTDPDQNGTYTGSFNPGQNTGANPRTFRFRFRASDNVGNQAPLLTAAQTVTQASAIDNDGDGFSVAQGDCNDSNPAVHPGATELCNGIDDDCDGQVDEGVKLTFYRDADGDGFGSAANSTQSCSAPVGYVVTAGDCNDNDAAVHPGATEVCNGIDDDCDGQVDEGVKLRFYRDADGDGYGDPAAMTEACEAPVGYVAAAGECNDTNAAIHPGAPEVCNGIDDNCNGEIDEGVTKTTFYRDADGDGYGNATVTTEACEAPSGYVATAGDCNDNDAAVHPGATEMCNGIDDDCDGQVDEGVQQTFYQDADGDGYGNAAATSEACQAPAGYVSNRSDCDDSNPAVHPGATEVCNGIDDNCDGQIDEGVKLTFYRDADNDGYGDLATTTQACEAPTGYVATAGDCNDQNPAIHPGATEVCNGMDDDCDGQIDEGVTQPTFYQDADGDGSGNLSVSTQACEAPAGYVTNSSDCNDSDPAVYPGATELCNGLDDNCDGQVDEGVQTTFYRDADGDGYGDSASAIQACQPPAGYAATGGDCKDHDPNVHPGAQLGITCSPDVTVTIPKKQKTATLDAGQPTITDNCTGVTLVFKGRRNPDGSFSLQQSSTYQVGTTYNGWAVIDKQNREFAYCVQKVTVLQDR